ncbi:Ribosomal protein S27 [Penicillium cf. griseofulvum]|nr:Ribosomal protein S27 [Penicillium cf. griseofulvum]
MVLAVDLLNPTPRPRPVSTSLRYETTELRKTKDVKISTRRGTKTWIFDLDPGPPMLDMEQMGKGTERQDDMESFGNMTLVPQPRSFFMDVKCPGCFTITTVFSHAQTVVICAGCSTVLCQPTGGKARLTEGCSFRRK